MLKADTTLPDRVSAAAICFSEEAHMLLFKIILSTCMAIGCSMTVFALGSGIVFALLVYAISGLVTVLLLQSLRHPSPPELLWSKQASAVRAR